MNGNVATRIINLLYDNDIFLAILASKNPNEEFGSEKPNGDGDE